MSIKLNILESKKLFKEHNYLVSDADFKNEFSVSYGKTFERALRIMLDKEPVVKQACKDIFGSLLDAPTGNTQSNDSIPDSTEGPGEGLTISASTSTEIVLFTGETSYESIIKLDKGDPKLKNTYRKIVTITHPDKVNSDTLNKFYIKSSEAFKNGDILSLYSICNELDVSFDITDEEIDVLREQNKFIRVQHINFERSHLWRWVNTKNENKKSEIIKHFLLNNAPAVAVLFS